MKLNDLHDNPGSSEIPHAGRARHRLRQGQDLRPRRQGAEGSHRRRNQRVRRRPDAAAPALAEARLLDPFRTNYNEVNIGRIQDAIDAGKLDAQTVVTNES